MVAEDMWEDNPTFITLENVKTGASLSKGGVPVFFGCLDLIPLKLLDKGYKTISLTKQQIRDAIGPGIPIMYKPFNTKPEDDLWVMYIP